MGELASSAHELDGVGRGLVGVGARVDVGRERFDVRERVVMACTRGEDQGDGAGGEEEGLHALLFSTSRASGGGAWG